MTAVLHRPAPELPTDYLELVYAVPLRPLRSEREHAQALRLLDRLAVLDRRSRGQEDYLDMLTLVVEQYEQQHHRVETADLKPLDVLRHLLEESGMTASDLGRLLGSRGLGSLVLTGKRQLSKAHIVKLAEHFRVEPGLFLEGSAESKR
jgi:HTH-type transcriptional regulator / antitoxin HigA